VAAGSRRPNYRGGRDETWSRVGCAPVWRASRRRARQSNPAGLSVAPPADRAFARVCLWPAFSLRPRSASRHEGRVQSDRARMRSRASAGCAGAPELGQAAQTGLRSPYQLHLAPTKRQVPFASHTPFIHSAGKNSTSCCTAFSGVRNAFSIATRKDTGHRCQRGGRVWRQRTRTLQWERVDHGFAFKICSISQRC
jgi:hypothetical protein